MAVKSNDLLITKSVLETFDCHSLKQINLENCH